MRKLHEIAKNIVDDWENPYFGAIPYIKAMEKLDSVTESYGYDSGTSIVNGFLANAKTWRGEVARKVKLELKEMLRG